VPFLFGKPAPVPKTTFYGLPSDDRFRLRWIVVNRRIDHRITTHSVSDTARYGHYWFASRQTAAIYGTANCFGSRRRRDLCRRAAVANVAKPKPCGR